MPQSRRSGNGERVCCSRPCVRIILRSGSRGHRSQRRPLLLLGKVPELLLRLDRRAAGDAGRPRTCRPTTIFPIWKSLQNLSTNRVDSSWTRWTRGDSQWPAKLCNSRTLATKDERHRLLRKCCLLEFDSRRLHPVSTVIQAIYQQCSRPWTLYGREPAAHDGPASCTASPRTSGLRCA